LALTKQDKIEIREIARSLMEEVMKEHIKCCPHHNAYLVDKAKVWGIMIGVALVSGGASGVVSVLFRAFSV